MKRRRCRRQAVRTVLAVAVVLAAAACTQEKPKNFPGAYPGTHTDVSSAHAFRYYGIATPAPVRDLGYSAWFAVDANPMGAVFTMSCDAAPEFVSQNGLREVPEPSQDTVEVEVFAKNHGWVDSGTGDTRYIRDADESQRVEVLVHKAGDDCTVYIDALTPSW